MADHGEDIVLYIRRFLVHSGKMLVMRQRDASESRNYH
jgi:hypothetical protein